MTSLAAPLYIVTGVLILAGAAKGRSPSPTATALRELKIPKPMLMARIMGIAEVALGCAAIAIGAPALWALVALAYGLFTIFILWALSGTNAVGSCGCFGHEDTPPTPGHAAFNAAAAAIAALAVTSPVHIGDFDGSLYEAAVTIVLIGSAIALIVALLTSLPRTLAHARGTAAPIVPTFSLENSTPSPQGPS